MKQVRIGLLGVGTVGQAVARALLERHDVLSRAAGTSLVLQRAAVKDPARPRAQRVERLTADAAAVAAADDVDLGIELGGGEEPARTLIASGEYEANFNGEAYSSIFFQNANHSVRVTDEFMRAVVDDKDWWTKNVIDGQPNEKLRARDLMMKISDSTWRWKLGAASEDATTRTESVPDFCMAR